MASFDSEHGEIVLRIVYDGLAHAGKTASLRALHQAFASRSLADPYAPGHFDRGRTAFFDWLELSAGSLDQWPLRCQVLTVPGQFSLLDRRAHLLATADAIVLVCESTTPGLEHGALALATLKTLFAGQTIPPIVILANKQDLPDAHDIDQVRDAFEARGLRAPVFGASALTGEGVRIAFASALNAARNFVRTQLAGDDPGARFSPAQTAAELLAAISAMSDEHPARAAMDAAIEAISERSR